MMAMVRVGKFPFPFVGWTILFIFFSGGDFFLDSYPFLSYHFHHRNISSFPKLRLVSRSHRLASPFLSRHPFYRGGGAGARP